MSSSVARPPKASPETRAVIEAVRACQNTNGWRKKDLLRGRQQYLTSFFDLLRECRQHGSTPAEIEGVLVAVYNAGRAIATEGLPPINESLADALTREQKAEGEENIATLAALHHPSIGTYRNLRAAMFEELEATRHVIDLLDVELLRMESQ
jgi:hypothetical protein